jgi:hypothetical protein
LLLNFNIAKGKFQTKQNNNLLTLTYHHQYKGIFRKDFVTKAIARIPLGTLACPSDVSEWFEVDEPSTFVKLKPVEGKKNIAQVRLQITIKEGVATVEDRLKGIVRHGEWTADTAGGSLIAERSAWYRNPQYILTMKDKEQVTIEVSHRAKETRDRLSFYLFKYDKDYDGTRQVLFNQTSDLVRFGNLNQPLPDVRVHGTFKLAKGKYVVMPVCEEAGVVGKFRLNIFAGPYVTDGEGTSPEEAAEADKVLLEKTKALCDLSKPLPTSGDGAWKETKITGEWTDVTSGGGNIAGRLAWTKNPQYVLWLGEATDVCITMSRLTKEEGIGFYVVKHPGQGRLKSLRKLVHYDDEFCKTDKFLRSYVVGVAHVKPEPQQAYVIIPCTHDPRIASPFEISVWTRSQTATVKLLPLTAKWLNRAKVKAEWRGEWRGGGPAEKTFWRNPQFLITFKKAAAPAAAADKKGGDKKGKAAAPAASTVPDSIPLVVQLLQQPEPKSIGFVAFRSPHKRGAKERIDKLPEVGSVVCKPEGYAQALSVAVQAEIDYEEAMRHSYVIVPSTFRPNERKAFQLNVWSDADFDCELLPQFEGGDEEAAADEESSEKSAEENADEVADDDFGAVRRERIAAEKAAAGDDDAASAESEDDDVVVDGAGKRAAAVLARHGAALVDAEKQSKASERASKRAASKEKAKQERAAAAAAEAAAEAKAAQEETEKKKEKKAKKEENKEEKEEEEEEEEEEEDEDDDEEEDDDDDEDEDEEEEEDSGDAKAKAKAEAEAKAKAEAEAKAKAEAKAEAEAKAKADAEAKEKADAKAAKKAAKEKEAKKAAAAAAEDDEEEEVVEKPTKKASKKDKK